VTANRKLNELARKWTGVVSVAVLMAALGVLYLSGTFMLEGLLDVTNRSLFEAGTLELTPAGMQIILVDMVVIMGKITFPVFMGVMTLAVVSNVAQVGFLFTAEPLTPKLEKLDPIKGAQKLLSLYSIVEAVKSVLKIVIISGAVYWAMRKEIENIPPLMLMSPWEILSFITSVSFNILLKSSAVLLVLALIDYAYQRWEYMKKLRMTKQEVKDEYKQSEGDPKMKARIKSLQREWAMQRMMEEVPRADVVITNPTHFAVALKYDNKEMDAPKVVAKGKNFMAQRIKDIARESGVPIMEDKPLARALHKSVEIGDAIPAQLYKAVAEILSYIYRLSGKKMRPVRL